MPVMNGSFVRRAVPAAFFFAIAAINVVRTFMFPEAALLLLGGAAGALALAVALWMQSRWGRWFALGLCLTVLANGAISLLLGHRFDTADPRFGFNQMTIFVAAGSLAVVALLASRRSREQFEPQWSNPRLIAIRATAVLSAAFGPAAAMNALDALFEGWIPGSPFGVVLLLGGFVLLAANRVAGLPVISAGLVLCALPDMNAVIERGPYALADKARFSAYVAERTYLFYGPFNRFAWMPALCSALLSTAILFAAVRKRSPG